MTKFFTVKEASLILGYSTNTVYKLLGEGRLKASRGSARQGRFRITKTSLEDFLKVKLPDDPLADFTLKPTKNTQVKKDFDSNPNNTQNNYLRPPITSPITTYLTRALIVLGLILILVDLFVSQNFSFFQQSLRLLIMAILIVLTYQSGSLSSPTSPG